MSSNPAKPRSIARQLVVLFTLAGALLVCAALGVLYLIIVSHAFEEDNAVLADKIAALRADLDNAGGPDVLRRELQIARAGERVTYWVRVLDATGSLAAETPRMKELLPPDLFPPPQERHDRFHRAKDVRVSGRLFSLVAVEERAGGAPYTLQVAQDRTADDQFTRRFGLLLGVVVLVGVIASAIIAHSVAHRGLRPLRDMTAVLERTRPSQLGQRIGRANWPRELQPLAAAFDDMLARLEESFTRLSQFSADIAHELRTPIANIRGEAEVALTRPRSSEEYRAVIESNIAECERLRGTIESLLFLARADAAREQVHRSRFDVRAATEEILSYYRHAADERNINLSCTGGGEIQGDVVLFRRALSNLLDNALRHTPAGGHVQVTIRQHEAGCEVAVADDGSGIPAEHLPRIFDRLYRVDPSRSAGGTGLGLAIVKSIAELHGGAVAAESSPGRGTTITLWLPASAAA